MPSNDGDSDHIDDSLSNSSWSGEIDSVYLPARWDVGEYDPDSQRCDGNYTGEELSPFKRYRQESTRDRAHIHSGTESSNVTQLSDPCPGTRQRNFAHQLNHHLLALGSLASPKDDFLPKHNYTHKFHDMTSPIYQAMTSRAYDADHEGSTSSDSDNDDETTAPPAAKKHRSQGW